MTHPQPRQTVSTGVLEVTQPRPWWDHEPVREPLPESPGPAAPRFLSLRNCVRSQVFVQLAKFGANFVQQ